MSWPVSLDNLTTAISGTNTTLDQAGGLDHANQHNTVNSAVNALETFLGTDSSQTTPGGANRILNSTSASAVTWTATPTIGGILTLNSDLAFSGGGAVSWAAYAGTPVIIGGGTGLNIRNNANNATNIGIADGGAVTFRGGVSGFTSLGFASGNGVLQAGDAHSNIRVQTQLSVANNGTSQLLTAVANPVGILFIIADNAAQSAIVSTTGTQVFLLQNPNSSFSITQGTASDNNVYITGSVLTIENKTGATRTYDVFAFTTS